MDIVQGSLVFMCWAALVFVASFPIIAFFIGTKTNWGVDKDYYFVAFHATKTEEMSSPAKEEIEEIEVIAKKKEVFSIHLLQPISVERRKTA